MTKGSWGPGHPLLREDFLFWGKPQGFRKWVEGGESKGRKKGSAARGGGFQSSSGDSSPLPLVGPHFKRGLLG